MSDRSKRKIDIMLLCVIMYLMSKYYGNQNMKVFNSGPRSGDHNEEQSKRNFEVSMQMTEKTFRTIQGKNFSGPRSGDHKEKVRKDLSGPRGGDHKEKVRKHFSDPRSGDLKKKIRNRFSGPRGGDHYEEQKSGKDKIQVVGFPPNRQRLLYDGKPLEDYCSLSDYNITSGSTVQVMLCLRGGSKNERGSEEGKYSDYKKEECKKNGNENNLSCSRSGDHSERSNFSGSKSGVPSGFRSEDHGGGQGNPNKEEGYGVSKKNGPSGFRSGDHSKGQGKPGKGYRENKSLDSRNGDNSERLDTSCFKSGDHSEMQYTSEKCEMNDLPCSKSEEHSERSYFSGSRVGDQDEYINECEECKPSVLREGDHEGEYRTHTCLRSVVHNEKQDNHTVSRSGDEKESYNMPFPALSMETSIEEVKERSK